MEQIKKLLLSLVMLLMGTSVATAYEFMVPNSDGKEIYYRTVSDVSVAVKSGEIKYTGVINIPSAVIYDGQVYSVVSIDQFAFSNCKDLTVVTIPNSVTVIGALAFSNTGLANITLPESVTTIGSYAFENCSSLINITIPDAVTKINNEAFYGCSKLAWVVIGSSVSSIGYQAFYNCPNLKTVINRSNLNIYIGSSSYGYVAYYANRVIKSNNSLEVLEELNDFVFNKESKKLMFYTGNGERVTLPEDFHGGTYSIDDEAFYGENFYTITIPNKVTGIGEKAFYNCKNLTSLTIGSGVLSIGYQAFINCPNLYKVFFKGNTKPTGIIEAFTLRSERIIYVSNDNYDDISSKGTIKKYPSLNSMFEVDGVVYIPVSMSARTCVAVDCTYAPEVTNINIQPTVLYRGLVLKVEEANDHALRNNPYITDATIDVPGIFPAYMMKDCNNVRTLAIGGNVTSFGTDALYGVSSLVSLSILPSATALQIADNSLFRSGKLAELTIGRNISYESGTLSSPFSGLSTLRSLKIDGETTSIGTKMFESTNIESVGLPNSLTSLGNYAFYNCKELSHVVLSQSLSVIPTSAFENCNSLQKIVFPSSLTQIGRSAFKNTDLQSLRFPASVSEIGAEAFDGCSKVGSIRFDDSSVPVTVNAKLSSSGAQELYIGRDITGNPFIDCNTLKNLELSESVKQINVMMFGGCSALEVATIHSKLTQIPTGAFFLCKSLRNIDIPETVVRFGADAFRGAGLSSVVIDKRVEEIGSGAFAYCANLQSATIAAKTIGEYAFSNSGLLQVEISEDVSSIGLNAFSDCIKLKNAEIGAASIGKEAFSGCSSLVTANLAERVQDIGSGAFENCAALVNVNIPDGNKIIDSSTFSGTSSLSEIVLPQSIGSIRSRAFYGSGIRQIVIPSAVRSIGSEAFANTQKLSIITFDSSREAVYLEGDALSQSGLETVNINRQINYQTGSMSAFRGNTTLRVVNMNNNPTSILTGMFFGCKALETVRVSENVTEIGAGAFRDCSALNSINIPDRVTEIQENTFYGCRSLKSIDLVNVKKLRDNSFANSGLQSFVAKSCLEQIAIGAFSGCTALEEFVTLRGSKTLEISNASSNKGMFADSPLRKVSLNRPLSYSSLPAYGYSPFYRVTTLQTVELGDYVSAVPDNMFYGCTGITDVVIGDGVKTFGKYAFSGCSSIERFYFGGNVEEIGEEAFSDCTAMVEMWSKAAVPPTCGNQALADINKWNCELIVPMGTVDRYQAADQWQDFWFTGESTGKTVLPTGISLSKLSLNMKIDETATVAATVLPTSVQNDNPVAWRSSDENVAVVANGKVVAVGAGKCQIIATTQGNGLIASACDVTVSKLDQELMWVQAFGGVYIGDQITFTGRADSNLDVKYTITGGDNVGMLSGNTFIVNNVGTVELTAVQPGDNRYNASNSVVRTLSVIPINPKNITLENEVTLHVGQTLSLSANIEPLNAYDKSVTWRSLDENIATIDDSGVITGVYNGETYIVATASNGLSANCRVMVNSLGDDFLSIEDAEIEARTAWDMPIALTNVQEIASAEFDVELPAALKFNLTSEGYLEPTLTDRASGYTIIANLLNDRTAHIEVFAMGNGSFTGESTDALLTIPVTSDTSVAPVIVKLTNVKLYSAAGETILPGSDNASITIAGAGLVGDVNENGVVNIADAIMIVNETIGVAQSGFNKDLADVDGNGRVTIADVILVVNYINGVIQKFPSHAPRKMAAASADMLMAKAEGSNDIYDVTITMNNNRTYAGMSLDINIPDGYEYIAESLEPGARIEDIFVAVNDVDPSVVKVAAFSAAGKPIADTDDIIFTLKLRRQGDNDNDVLSISNIVAADVYGNEYQLNDASCVLSGDMSDLDSLEEMIDEKVYVQNRDIHFVLSAAQTVAIADIAGVTTFYDLPAGHSVVSKGKQGVYIVIIRNNTFKVMVK